MALKNTLLYLVAIGCIYFIIRHERDFKNHLFPGNLTKPDFFHQPVK